MKFFSFKRALFSLSILSVSQSYPPSEAYADKTSSTNRKKSEMLSKGNQTGGKSSQAGIGGKPAAADPQVSVQFSPLFQRPGKPEDRGFFDLIGQNKELVGSMSWGPDAAAARNALIKQLTLDFRLQKPKSPQQMQVGVKLLRALEEQVHYQERYKALGAYANADVVLQKTKLWELRQELIKQANLLVQTFPKSEFVGSWKLALLSQRLKIEDPSAIAESRNLIKSSPDFYLRLKVIGLGIALKKGQDTHPFGKVSESFFISDQDETTLAVLNYYQAKNEQIKGSKAKSADHYFVAAQKFSAEADLGGNKASLVVISATNMVELSLLDSKPNQSTLARLKELNFLPLSKSYLETLALRSLKLNYKLSLNLYQDILKIGEPPNSEITAVESRILDIYLAFKDVSYFESQWDKVSKLEGTLADPRLESRISKTQAVTIAKAFSAKDQLNVMRFVRMHDFFVKISPTYASSDTMNFKVLEALTFLKQHEDVIARAEAIVSKSTNKGVQLTSLRFSARSREALLGLKQKVEFEKQKKFSGKEKLAKDYIWNLDRIAALTSGPEKQDASFQAAYVEHQLGEQASARKRFEATLKTNSRYILAPFVASYVLSYSLAQKNYEYSENFARFLEKEKIAPSDKSIGSLRLVIENNGYALAVQLAEAGQFLPAAEKFQAFHKEFISSKRAPQALLNASTNFQKANKGEQSLAAKELFLKLYPKDGVSQELRWAAAEQAKSIGQLLRAADHYEQYARAYPKEGLQKLAFVQASSMHKGLGRYAHAVSDLEFFVKSSPSKNDQLTYLKEISELQDKYGKPIDAAAALQRVLKVAAGPDDQVWALGKLVGIYQRLAQLPLLRVTIATLLTKKPRNEAGQKEILKARHILGKLDLGEVKDFEPIKEKNLYEGTKRVLARYDQIKANLLAPCEVSGLDWCSVGYFEASKLAEIGAKKILEVEAPPTLNPKEVNQIRALVQEQSERLSVEAKQLAEQAEQALASGAPDEETAERIRSHAQSHRGDLAEGLKTQ